MRSSVFSRCGTRAALVALTCAVVAAAGAADKAGKADKHPDFSGIWGPYVEPGSPGFRALRGRMDLPLTPEGRDKVAAYRKLVGPTDNPGAHCLGSGMPESLMFSGGYPMEIIQRPEQITIIYEAHNEVRRLYLGDKIIPPADRLPARNGYSTAHWEGDTLVVETGSLREQEDQAYAHSDQATIVERYHEEQDSHGTRVLVASWTMTDPAFYTKPVTFEKKWGYEPKGILLPYECDEETWLDHLEDLKAGRVQQKAY